MISTCTKCKRVSGSLALVLAMILSSACQAQYAPAAGLPGSTAISASADSIVMWAESCTVVRGPQDIAVPSSGYASAGDSSQAVGPAGTNTIVSLGDGGVATLSFAHAIVNGPGFDFAVFENGFALGSPQQAFLELGFVEVSSDGQRFVRFPALDDMQNTTQLGNAGTMDAATLHNLAGKYVSGYGTPFDLEEIKDSAGIDIDHITHVRVRDVVGTLSDTYATHDSRGRKINDPYPTAFASGGFDLDAVAVMHAEGLTGVQDAAVISARVYPNPVSSRLYVQTCLPSQEASVSVRSITGQVVQSVSFAGAVSIDMSAVAPGVYEATVTSAFSSSTHLIVKQ